MKGEALYKRRLEFLLSMISSWLEEVEGEVKEAVGILSESDGSGQWWAQRIRRRLLDDSPPDPLLAQSDDQPATLIEIAFWSGWLRGELETLRRCSMTVETVVSSDGGQLRLPVGTPAVQFKSKTARSYGELKASAERLIERIEAHNSVPGAELVSIHLNDVLEAKAEADVLDLERECFKALNNHLSDNKVHSLVRLAFDSGILAGHIICERNTEHESASRASKRGNDRRMQ